MSGVKLDSTHRTVVNAFIALLGFEYINLVPIGKSNNCKTILVFPVKDAVKAGNCFRIEGYGGRDT